MKYVPGPAMGVSGIEARGVGSSRLEGYAGGRNRQQQDLWFMRSASEKHMHRHLGREDATERASSDAQRAHAERLEMVGAVDKTEMEVMSSERTPLLASPAAGVPVRTRWDLPYSISTGGTKRTMTVSEVQLLQSIGQGVICTDLQGNITYWNRAAEAMYMWKAEEVLGRNILQLLTPKDMMKDSLEVIGKVGNGDSWSGPYPALRKDGAIINTVVTDTPIVDHNNKIIGIIGVSFDVTTLPIEKSKLRRSFSDEGLASLEGEKETVPATGSDEGRSILSWRRVHVDAENKSEDISADIKSGSSRSSNLLRIGRSSVQQLLRKLQIGTGARQRHEEKSGYETEKASSPTSATGTVEHSLTFPVYAPHESIEAEFGDRDGSSILLPLGLHARPSGRGGEGGSWESLSSQKEVIKEVMSIAVPQPGTFDLPLSRSSSGSGPCSATGRDASSVGSPVERSFLDNVWSTSRASINFQRAEEDFQLQLALALRVAAEAAAVDDPDLSANVRGPKGGTKLMPGITKTEATAYRYWVSNCLSYDDRIEDGFYEVWGMSPYVWSMCTDSSELGRMPPLESLRAVAPSEATFEVVLVDRNMDHNLRELEDKAVGLAYGSTEVLVMASQLSIMVANVMGGPVASDDELMEAWQAASNKLMQVLGTIVLPIGYLRVGLSRHRALLFKVMADSVGLPCRLVRGSSYCGKEDDASVVVKCGDDREWMVDLLVNPGKIMPPDKRLAAPPAVIASPLQFERQTPFAGSGVSVLHWTRGERVGKDGGNRGESPKRKNMPEPMRNVSSPRADYAGENNPPGRNYGLEFFQADGSQVGKNINRKNRGRGPSEEGRKEQFSSPYLLERPGERNPIAEQRLELWSPDVGKGMFNMDDVLKPPAVVDNKETRHAESPVEEGGRGGYDRYWAKEERRPTGSDDSVRSGGAGRMLDQIAMESSDFEIAWEDIVMGERIGQGSYGKVYRADWQGSDVAVKVFLDQDLKTEALEEFKSEVAIMRRLRHPNIVLFMGAVTKPPNLSIITEFCPRGSLYRLLHRPNRELDDRKRIRMAVDVAKGMNYLHRCSPPIVHRDLKSPNLLVDKNWTVKVGDFGLSRQKHSTFLSSKSSAGTPEWMAPEVLRNEPSDEKSDVYSFGVILWELSTLQVPWNGMNPIQVVGAVGFQHRRLPIPDYVDRSIAAIIQSCWRTDSNLRPSFADLMQDLRNLQQRPPSSPSLQGSSSSAEQKEPF